MDARGLPETLRKAVRAEFGRAFHSPYETPIVIASNGLLMTGAWLLLPRSWFFTLQGTLAFPMVLASWMYADVPATNVLGSDSRRVLAALDDPVMLRRLLLARNAVLWLLVAPLCSAIALVLGAVEQRWIVTLLTIVGITLVPLGALGLSALVGTRWPYHPRPLRWRWENRRDLRRTNVRWLILVLVPYAVVPTLCAAMAVPSLLVWKALSDNSIDNLTDGEFAVGALLACVVGVTAWRLGQRTVLWLTRRRHEQLVAYLSDPGRADAIARYIGRENLRKRLAPLEGEPGRVRYADGQVEIEAAEERLVVRPPFGLEHTGEYDSVRLAPLFEALDADRVVAVLLVRLGGYAAGVFEGERLVASKVGSRFVKNRHKKGGSSANRFRRRREEQARALIDEAAAVAVRVLGPWRDRAEFAALGGDRRAVTDVLAASRELAWLEQLAIPRFFTVEEPRQRVLERLPYELYAAEIVGL